MYLWLWSAGSFRGVCDDQNRAMRCARAHLAAGETVLAESARLTLGIHGPRHIRTGHTFTARLICGHARWTEVIEAQAS
jgi:hypothetical protein